MAVVILEIALFEFAYQDIGFMTQAVFRPARFRKNHIMAQNDKTFRSLVTPENHFKKLSTFASQLWSRGKHMRHLADITLR
jgi:hypothetical protein